MHTFLIDHMPGCSPLRPCASCGAAAFLRSKLSEPDFNELLEIIRKASAPPSARPFSKENPIPDEMTITHLDLPFRVTNALMPAGIQTIGDLTSKSQTDLMRIQRIGHKARLEIREALEKVGR